MDTNSTWGENKTDLLNVANLCQTCWQMTTERRCLRKLRCSVDGSGYLHNAIEAGTHFGCPVCRTIWNRIEHGLLTYDIRRTWYDYRPSHDHDNPTSFLLDGVRFYALPEEEILEEEVISDVNDTFSRIVVRRGQDKVIEFQVFTTKEDIAAETFHQRPPEPDIGGLAAAAAARDYITSCFRNHDKCPMEATPSLPTRVLDVGDVLQISETSEDQPTLKLHVSWPGQRAAYVALSYCWGGPQEVVTTSKTLPFYTESMELSKLPQAIQDAVIVTRSLRIRYLWVDSLCILQDDASDQSYEIERMGKIYKGSTVTIAAANSSRATDGFLKPVNPPPSIKTAIRLDGHSKLGNIWLVPQIDHDNSQEPLALRGWAFQEQILSPRLLHYGSKGITWHCQSKRSLHVLPHYVNYTLGGARFPRFVSEDASTDSTERKPESTNGQNLISSSNPFPDAPRKFSSSRGTVQEEFWPDIVKHYSQRRLTFARDRLLAISGVASEFHKLSPDTYLAGIWKGDLIRQLAWRQRQRQQQQTAEPETAHEPSGRCSAPSWSWASTNQPVTFGPVFVRDAEFVDCAVTPKLPSSPFGDVVGSQLRLFARCMEASEDDDDCWPRVTFDGDGRDASVPSRSRSRSRFHPLCLMLLGYSSHGAPIGLVLDRIDETAFKRVGYFESLDLCDPYTILNDRIKMTAARHITIV